ncbi:MFS transporter [Novosphingobium terrae]|uniref:MFS transporter n=1 Tax=Novosphingobium terrae TaxID=2726189 RepID=UPI0019800225|nr:MFS transporter [Novosphingobium terrae]
MTAAASVAGAARAADAGQAVAVAPVWDLRLATGLAGILIAAMMSGLNDRVTGVTLTDVAGARGLAGDDAHLLGTIYAATQLGAMPIASWFAATFSLRRFLLAITLVFLTSALLLPLAPNFGWLLALRAVQGVAGGAMVPLLMGAALRFLPPAIKLQGLGFYSLTATFSPNLALWFAASWMDGWNDWRLTYWQVIPVGLIVLAMVGWGLPQDPVKPERLREIDGLGLASGPLGLMLLAFVAEEGERLDWFHSPLILGALLASAALIGIFILSEWHHPQPFMKLQMLSRRNFWLGLPLFIGILMVVVASSLLPAAHLAEVQHFRPLQIAPIGLIISLPQILLAPLVSALLYHRWVDARHVIAMGLALIATSCWLGAQVTDGWMVREFWLAQACQMIGQPLALVPFLYVSVSTLLSPAEGALYAGLINTLKTLASVIGAALVERLLVTGTAAHLSILADRAGRLAQHEIPALSETQAITGAIADAYGLAACLAALLIIPTLSLKHVPPPPPAKKV